MLSLGPIGFAAPWALIALAALPALWWLLRLSPPAPRRVRFPPMRFLADIGAQEESVARTPWWLLVLRLAAVLAVILGCAQPLLNAEEDIAGSGPLVIIIDDGWASGHHWNRRIEAARALIDRAERGDRPVVLVTTAPQSAEKPAPSFVRLPPGEARDLVEGLQPKPWPTDRAAALATLDRPSREPAPLAGGEIWWLSDGMADGGGADTALLASRLQRLAPLTVMAPAAADRSLLLRQPERSGEIMVSVLRADAAGDRTAIVLARSDAGVIIAREVAELPAGVSKTEVRFHLPAEIVARIARLELEGEPSAGGVVLVDARWQRRPVGLVESGGSRAGEPPLLDERYYLERALAGFAEVRIAVPASLMERDLAVMILADDAPLDPGSTQEIARWVEAGGMLIRFAGPRLAARADADIDDPLLPVKLRAGDRSIGGALSWQEPAALASFDPKGPFAGMDAAEDVAINRQVLSQPSFDADQRAWARLDDGTPLVTARPRGDGWLVLFHVTANADWSNLPLSGLFVEMLQRLVALSRGTGNAGGAGGPPLSPIAALDGRGVLSPPPTGTRAIPARDFAASRVSAVHPPGIYGNESERRALNLGAGIEALRAMEPMPQGVGVVAYGDWAERDLRGWLLAAALGLLLLDLAIAMVLRGLIGRRGDQKRARSVGTERPAVRSRAALLALALTGVSAAPGGAQTIIGDGTAEPAALTTSLAYIDTGESDVDAVSRAGLNALAIVVNRRTAAELGPAVAVDPAVDELAFYPLLYWPIGTREPALAGAAVARLVDYMDNGGTIVFDLRDSAGARLPALRALARRLDIPPLTPLPADHVLRRAYYLLGDLPGRYSGEPVWVVDQVKQINDGVTPVIVGSNDWAGAWAADDAMRPMLPVIPGGEEQRELAYRFGINLVMHVLTGNYKADQVHLPAIMERLGQ